MYISPKIINSTIVTSSILFCLFSELDECNMEYDDFLQCGGDLDSNEEACLDLGCCFKTYNPSYYYDGDYVGEEGGGEEELSFFGSGIFGSGVEATMCVYATGEFT